MSESSSSDPLRSADRTSSLNSVAAESGGGAQHASTRNTEGANAAEELSEDPIRRACALNSKVVSEYIEDYELDDGEHCPYRPNEAESVLVADAIYGLLTDSEFISTFNAWQDLVRPLRAGSQS